MVMEYLPYDLKVMMDKIDQPLLQSECLYIVKQVLSALEFMHGNWIIHRDLKTANLLITAHGEVKVADFGLARTYTTHPIQLMTPSVVTLWYRAPEILLGSRQYTPAVDIWSVGCIFGELILHEPLFPGTRLNLPLLLLMR